MPNTKLHVASICMVQNLEFFQKGVHLLLCSIGNIHHFHLKYEWAEEEEDERHHMKIFYDPLLEKQIHHGHKLL